MILTVTLNPAIDRLYYVDNLDNEGVHRCSQYSINAGGKGINVSKVIKMLGEALRATGYLGGYGGEFIKKELDSRRIENDFIHISEETRTTISIKPYNDSPFELVEEGPYVKSEEIQSFMDKYKKLLPDTKLVVISGSLPRGVDIKIYKDLIELANENGIRTIVDVNKNLLPDILHKQPYMVKPNIEELSVFSNKPLNSEKAIIETARTLIQKGARNVVVSLGEEGMLLVNRNDAWRSTIPSIKVSSPVGSGDASVAGLAIATILNYSVQDTLKIANACGMSNAIQDAIGEIDLNDIDIFKKRIKVEKIT